MDVDELIRVRRIMLKESLKTWEAADEYFNYPLPIDKDTPRFYGFPRYEICKMIRAKATLYHDARVGLDVLIEHAQQ